MPANLTFITFGIFRWNMDNNEQFMWRCLQLAKAGQGRVAPNPMVGAVLVHENRILGEGYHRRYGEAHAEVNCLASVKEKDRALIPKSTLFVSLEPCAHFGKTPPCADLIIAHKIPRVVVGCRDPFSEVNGRGIEKLRLAGVEVQPGVLEKACIDINKRFFTFHTLNRPFVVLKWAQTMDGKTAADTREVLSGAGSGKPERLFISNACTNRIVHKWRSQEMGIVVGTNTALHDDPELSTRIWPGASPVRIVVDRELKLPPDLKLFDRSQPTIVINLKKQTEIFDVTSPGPDNLAYYQVTDDVSLVHQMINGLYRMNIQSILVEGGTQLLQSFIDEGMWDEARIITNRNLSIGSGLPAPVLKDHRFIDSTEIFSDTITRFYREEPTEQ
jgi:diaminohydroxyphosphoribosylaminopyrimidine deaminase/5-amino-6-(5-phosphoribosylamino)uracil reductase